MKAVALDNITPLKVLKVPSEAMDSMRLGMTVPQPPALSQYPRRDDPSTSSVTEGQLPGHEDFCPTVPATPETAGERLPTYLDPPTVCMPGGHRGGRGCHHLPASWGLYPTLTPGATPEELCWGDIAAAEPAWGAAVPVVPGSIPGLASNV